VTDSQFLETILAEPENDAPRLAYADWLVENCPLGAEGQQWTDRAEFIRVQCELADCAAREVELFNDDVEWKDCEGVSANWCPNCGDCCCKNPEQSKNDHDCPLHSSESPHAQHHILQRRVSTLRRRERELLSAVSTETCPRCKGRKTVTEQRSYRIESSGCGECLASGVVQVSNCVRWAGKLGGRNANHTNPCPNQDGWHGFWSADVMRGAGEELVMFRFVRGFVGVVSLSCAALVGDVCPRCSEGRRQWQNGMNFYTCPTCKTTAGRVNSLAGELSRLPLTGVQVSGKRPYDATVENMAFGLFDEAFRPDGDNDPESNLPTVLFDALEGGTFNEELDPQRSLWYATSAAATDALERAALLLVRKRMEVMA